MCREEQLKYHMSPRDHFSAQNCSRAPGLGNLPCKAQNEVRVRLSEAQNENVQSELHTRRKALNVSSSVTVSFEKRQQRQCYVKLIAGEFNNIFLVFICE